jgi:membrane peptidoglycan carboxypeptidase
VSKRKDARLSGPSFFDLFEANATVPTGRQPTRLGALGKALFMLPLFGLILASFLVPAALAASGTIKAANDAFENMDSDLGTVVAKQRSVLLDKNGDQWGQLISENRVVIELADINPVVIKALLDTEDANFYKHGGADGKGLLRAIYKNATTDNKQGASTITQQLVENLRAVKATTDKERSDAKAQSPRGKLQELRYAVELERKYTKDEILTQYLNTVYLGNGAYGIAAAAQRYFSVSASDLTVDQAATLIAMLKSPIDYDPIASPAMSRLRRDVVMKRMVEEGNLAQTDYDALRAAPTALNESLPKSGCAQSKYPYYCAALLKHILSSPEFGKTQEQRQAFIDQGGMTIKTALNPRVMEAAQKAVDDALGRDNPFAAGTAVIEPGTGQLMGIAQNRTFGTKGKKTEIVLPATAQFQPGSNFKPITLAAALEQGISAKTRYNTPSPLKVAGLDFPPGGYRNDDFKGHGVMDAYGATKSSVNTYFVQLVRDVGVKNTADMARRLGMTSVPTKLSGREGSITLGAYETSPIQMATVFATFAARGVRCDPVLILSATNITTGAEVKVPDGNCHQAILPNVADTVADVLRAPFTSGGTASKLNLSGGRKAGGKTGTTNGSAATWFSGFTPQAAMSVWVGDPRGGNKHPVQNVNAYGTFYPTVFGGTIAGPIWKQAMEDVHKGVQKKWLPAPGGVSSSVTSRVVPSVKGMKLDEAVSLLQSQGFVVKLRSANAKADKYLPASGYVQAQSPAAGSKTGYATTISLRLTAGSPTGVVLPEVN